MELQLCVNCMRVKTGEKCEFCGHTGDAEAVLLDDSHYIQSREGEFAYDSRFPGAPLDFVRGVAVYKGWDIRHSTPVWIERVSFSVVPERSVRCFPDMMPYYEEGNRVLREGKDAWYRRWLGLQKLDRPGFPKVKDLFDSSFILDEDTDIYSCYAVLEMVEGTPFGGKQPVSEVLRLMRPLVYDLCLAHREGIYHRNICPEAICIVSQGYARFRDFGNSCRFPQTMENMGKAKNFRSPYWAPEEWGTSEAQNDIYGVCATIYECLTGRKPPSGRDMSLGTGRFLWGLCPADLTRRQLSALQRGVSPDPEARIPDMATLYRELFT